MSFERLSWNRIFQAVALGSIKAGMYCNHGLLALLVVGCGESMMECLAVILQCSNMREL
jgi:hypothetical protein